MLRCFDVSCESDVSVAAINVGRCSFILMLFDVFSLRVLGALGKLDAMSFSRQRENFDKFLGSFVLGQSSRIAATLEPIPPSANPYRSNSR